MADYSRIDTCVRATVMSEQRKIAICPFAEEGMMAKQILNYRYGVVEDFILDNRLSSINPNILSIDNLKENKTEDLFILLMCSNREINRILERDIRRVDDKIIIQNVLSPVYAIVPKKRDFLIKLKNTLQTQSPVEKGFVRIGNPNDGGYIFLDDFNDTIKVYSFGIANDVSFERDLANRGLKIQMYDHTIFALPEEHENFYFHSIGISQKDEMENHKLSLETILKMNGDNRKDNLVLKMDVEGAEWDVIAKTPSEIWKQFRQMAFEFHQVTDEKNPKILKALEKLNQTHQLVWIHGNNYGYIEKAGDIEIPAYLELTYVNKAIYRTVPKACQFPLHIDSPCSPNIEEYILGNWGISE